LIDQVQQNAAELQHHNATARQHHNKPTPSAELFIVATTGREQHRSDNRRIAIEHKTQPTPLTPSQPTTTSQQTLLGEHRAASKPIEPSKQAGKQASERTEELESEERRAKSGELQL